MQDNFDEQREATQEFKALGNSAAKSFEGFETFPVSQHLVLVSFSIDDVTARCPITGQPDYYSVDINYQPVSLLLETKTVKLYLESFRETGVFAEHFASQIADDIQKATLSPAVSVMLRQRVRGGIETTAHAEITLDDDESLDHYQDESIDDFKEKLEALKNSHDHWRLNDDAPAPVDLREIPPDAAKAFAEQTYSMDSLKTQLDESLDAPVSNALIGAYTADDHFFDDEYN